MGQRLVCTLGRKIFAWLLSLLLLAVVFTYNLPIDESWSVWSMPLSGKVIALDAGHGGPDGGAVSQSGLVEKDIALNIALYLRDFLQEAGALVIMTRETDKDLADPGTRGNSKRKTEDLYERVRMVNESTADCLVSIHLNAIPSSRWTGAQTFYFPGRKANGALAWLIQDEIERTLQNTTRDPKKNSDIFILKSVNMPSAMVEVGFLSNPGEAMNLSRDEYQRQMANSIYQGILRFFSGEHPPHLEK